MKRIGKYRTGSSNVAYTHGMTNTPTWNSWRAMKYRANSSLRDKDKTYRDLGVCEEWLKFENFYRDMGDRPEGTSIERIDNLKGYSKDNCKWATKSEQNINKSHWKKPNKHGYTGVKYYKKGSGGKHYIATCGGEYICYTHTAEEAAKAYDREAYKLYGDKAILNFMKEEV